MSVNPLTHLSNTICYIDKPTLNQTEKARLEAAKNAAYTKVGADEKDAAKSGASPSPGSVQPAEPAPTINGNGQPLGRIINTSA